MENSLASETAFDVELYSGSESNSSISDNLADQGITLSDYAKEAYEFTDYTNPAILGSAVLTDDLYTKLQKEYFLSGREDPVPFIRLSDYNKLLSMKGKEALVLNDGQIAFSYSSAAQDLRNIVQEKWNQTGKISLLGQEYNIYPKMLSESIVSAGAGSSLAIIVPDSFLIDTAGKVTGGFAVSSRFLQFNCTGDSKTVQDEFEKQVESAYKKDAASVPYYMVTRNIITASYAGTKAIIAYVGIYIGLVFLLTSAAVLSLQQLSEISDNRQRYLVLKKIGADDHLINITILRQTAIYFLLPLSLAIVHSIVGLTVANDAIRSLGGVNAIQNILITAALILVIYGAYFLATFAGSRRMIVREGRNE
jgi:putative ABC transport system permease protein